MNPVAPHHPVAEEILKGEVAEGETLLADYKDKAEELAFSVKKNKSKKEKKEE